MSRAEATIDRESAGSTLVTALFDVAGREQSRSRRSVGDYLALGEFVLAQRTPLVCFCDPPIASAITVARERLGLLDRTLVVPRPLEETEAFGVIERVASARRANPIVNANLAKDTPAYTACVLSKFELVEETARSNPFGSGALAWIDFGIAHVAEHRFADEDAIFDTPGDGVRLLILRPWQAGAGHDLRAFARAFRGHVAAGFFAGRRETMSTVARLAREAARDALDRGVAINDEQALQLVVDEHASLFAPFPGDYAEILSNAHVLRGGGGNLRMQMAESIRLRDWRWACEIGRRVAAGLEAGTFECAAATLAEIIEQWFVAEWHAGFPSQQGAARAARLYARLVSRDATFRSAFEARRDDVLRNFAHLDEPIEPG